MRDREGANSTSVWHQKPINEMPAIIMHRCVNACAIMHTHTRTLFILARSRRRRPLILCDCTPQGFVLLCWMSSLLACVSRNQGIPAFTGFSPPLFNHLRHRPPSSLMHVLYKSLTIIKGGILAVTVMKQPQHLLLIRANRANLGKRHSDKL